MPIISIEASNMRLVLPETKSKNNCEVGKQVEKWRICENRTRTQKTHCFLSSLSNIEDLRDPNDAILVSRIQNPNCGIAETLEP